MTAAMGLSVKLKDTDMFKKLVAIIKDTTEDTRVPKEVREEIKGKINKVIKSGD